ncbi:MAG: hypothetical protein IJI05_04025 [Erysipelotrichaceae bacterium]|nr:hypothetical protein [Erysipelotrichaceae bacterium]
MKNEVLSQLKKEYTIKELDTGKDAHLSSKGMHFDLKSYEVENLGHLCILEMNAMLGVMKMETIVLSVETCDMPLFNMDTIDVMKKHTMLAEMYNSQLTDFDPDAGGGFTAIVEADSDLPDYESGEHLYDDTRYKCFYGKTVQGKAQERFDRVSREYLAEYLRQVRKAPQCDPEAKKQAAMKFAQGLLDNGGPAVDQFRKLFGDETTRRLVLKHMYGVID